VSSSSRESRLEIERHLSAQFDGKAMEIFASQLAFAAPFGYRVLVPWNGTGRIITVLRGLVLWLNLRPGM
jgi:hypothetical protein